jgi:hypothetical protein
MKASTEPAIIWNAISIFKTAAIKRFILFLQHFSLTEVYRRDSRITGLVWLSLPHGGYGGKVVDVAAP